ncbi:MAG TPA: hypothetical protein VJT73_06305, partial [Polyangiaceae bacterium]|nr:hypothetical protein [Polyangiaceae bacterium]
SGAAPTLPPGVAPAPPPGAPPPPPAAPQGTFRPGAPPDAMIVPALGSRALSRDADFVKVESRE